MDRFVEMLPSLELVGKAVLKHFFDIDLETSWWSSDLETSRWGSKKLDSLICMDMSNLFLSSNVIVGRTRSGGVQRSFCDDVGLPFGISFCMLDSCLSFSHLDAETKASKLMRLLCRDCEWVQIKSRSKMLADRRGNWICRFKSKSLDDACNQLDFCKEELLVKRALLGDIQDAAWGRR